MKAKFVEEMQEHVALHVELRSVGVEEDDPFAHHLFVHLGDERDDEVEEDDEA